MHYYNLFTRLMYMYACMIGDEEEMILLVNKE